MYYFVSNKNFNQQILYPRIPDNRLTRKGYEDNITPRICVSKSLLGCIHSSELYTKYRRIYVYTCSSDYVMQPNSKQVDDAYLTGEEWILKPVQMKLFLILHITKEIINGQYSRWIFKDKDDLFSFSINEFDHERYYKQKTKKKGDII